MARLWQWARLIVGLWSLGLVPTVWAAPAQLRMTIPVTGLPYYPVMAARDLGYFRDEGIDMNIVVTQGDGPDVDGLIAGSVQFSVTTPNRLLTAYEQGQKLLGVMSLRNRIGVSCFINKQKAAQLGITQNTPVTEKFRKLRGLVIGGTRPGSFTNVLADEYLTRVGLVPQRDAKVVGIGAGAPMIAAIEHGQIDVACNASPTPELALQRGQSVMFIDNSLGEDQKYKEFLFALLYVKPDYAKENPAMVRKVVHALQRAITYIKSTPFEQQQAMLTKDFGTLDPAVLRAALISEQAAIEPSGRITQASVDAAENLLMAAGMLTKPIPWTAVTDNSYLSQ